MVAFGSVGVVPGKLVAGDVLIGLPIGVVEVARRMVGAAPAVGGPAARSGMVGAGAGLMPGAPAVRSGMVGAGAGLAVGAPAARRGMVGAGAGTVAVGGMGGLTGGASGTVAEGTAGGASAAFNVTRTVSFLRGTLEVCLDGLGDGLSFSLMLAGLLLLATSVRRLGSKVSNPQRGKILQKIRKGREGGSRSVGRAATRRAPETTDFAKIFDALSCGA